VGEKPAKVKVPRQVPLAGMAGLAARRSGSHGVSVNRKMSVVLSWNLSQQRVISGNVKPMHVGVMEASWLLLPLVDLSPLVLFRLLLLAPLGGDCAPFHCFSHQLNMNANWDNPKLA
jgi:hypothetical protein